MSNILQSKFYFVPGVLKATYFILCLLLFLNISGLYFFKRVLPIISALFDFLSVDAFLIIFLLSLRKFFLQILNHHLIFLFKTQKLINLHLQLLTHGIFLLVNKVNLLLFARFISDQPFKFFLLLDEPDLVVFELGFKLFDLLFHVNYGF